MGTAGEDLATGGIIYPGFDYVLSFGGTIGAVVWFRVVRHVGGDNKDGCGNARRIPPDLTSKRARRTTHRMCATPVAGKVLRTTGMQKSFINQTQEWNGGTVGGPMYDLRGLCTGAGFRGRGAAEETLVETRRSGGGYHGNAGGGVAGGIS